MSTHATSGFAGDAYKIAFTSCMSASHYPGQQPIWTEISKAQPDCLVLLGDSVYIDVPAKPDSSGNAHPSNGGYSDHDFAVHLRDLYAAQLAIPEFSQLLQQLKGQVYAVWDDHDFLWNNAGGKEARRVVHKGQALFSANLFRCWRKALAQGGAGFPASTRNASVSKGYVPPLRSMRVDDFAPGYASQVLTGGRVVLHLPDGRSWRQGSDLIGKLQRQQMAAVLARYPDALHILASGSTVQGAGRESWSGHVADFQWLQDQASRYNLLVISGDIHKNALPHPMPCGSKSLHEATASGAAVNFNPFGSRAADSAGGFLDYSGHFGLLSSSQGAVEVSLYHHGQRTHQTTKALPF